MDLKQYTGIPYVDGRRDCYGLARMFYYKEHGLFLRNYARPIDFAFLVEDPETKKRTSLLDLFGPNFANEGFVPHMGNWKSLAVGDALLIGVGETSVANHCAIYVGNNLLLHHLYGRMSSVDALTDYWKSATIQVVRHPQVYKTRPVEASLDFMEVMNPHVRRRLQLAQAQMDARRGALRADPARRDDSGATEPPPGSG